MHSISDLNTALAGRYVVEREIGAGGMATVYLARDVRHDRQVAIKVLHAELVSAVGADRFLREITFGAQLQHPHILTLIDSGTTNGLSYYVMPFVEGKSLRDRLVQSAGGLPIAEVTRILRDTVDALAHAHRHGIVHRDIKPDNIMLADRHALVVDFGVAKAMSHARGDTRAQSTETLTSLGTSLGTPAYMSPEQAAGDPDIDHRTDLYAVGIVAYEMVSGRPPFSGTTQALLAAQITQPPPPLTGAPPALKAIIARCLEKQPEARYQSADDLLADVEQLTTPTNGVPSSTSRRPSRRTAAAGLITVLVLGLIGNTYMQRVQRERWARETGIPAVQRLAGDALYDSAFAVQKQVADILPRDSAVQSLWTRIARRGVVRTTPAGATVERATFTDTTRWETIGTTPTDTMLLPRGSPTRLRLSLPGYRTANVLVSSGSQSLEFVLDSAASSNAEMVHVSAGQISADLPGVDQHADIALSDFLIDRYEVSNKEYRQGAPDSLPLDARGRPTQQYVDRPRKHARHVGADAAGRHDDDVPVRRLRRGRQCSRVVLERRRRGESLHPRWRLQRSSLLVQ